MSPVNTLMKKILLDRDDRARRSRLKRPNATTSGGLSNTVTPETNDESLSEEDIRLHEKSALDKLIEAQGISKDNGSSYSGLYELCGEDNSGSETNDYFR
jgi:hypothetical protein